MTWLAYNAWTGCFTHEKEEWNEKMVKKGLC